MRVLRLPIAIALSLLITLSSLGAAVARGDMAANGIICGDGSYTVVLAADGLPLFDSNGAPVELLEVPCLDCVFGAFALLPPDSNAPRPEAMPRALDAAITDPTWRAQPRLAFLARGPPTLFS